MNADMKIPLQCARTGLAPIGCFPVLLALLSGGTAAGPCRLDGKPPAGAITASWYGKEHHGQITASGTKFDERQLTAAHPTLPLNAHIQVTNVANGRSIEVIVTDRGPGYGRGIDLSEGAARLLDMRRCGLALVLVTPSRDLR